MSPIGSVLRAALAGAVLACVAMSHAISGAGAGAQLVADKSQITFVTKQMGVPVEGAFRKFDAQIAFDPRHPEGGTVALQIDTGSASLGVPMSDAELPRAPWFNVAQFPWAKFQSSAIKGLGGGRFEVSGKLTIKGASREVVVPVAITPGGYGGTSVATGSFTIQRLDYKVGEGEWTDTSMVDNAVQVNFRLTLAGLGPL